MPKREQAADAIIDVCGYCHACYTEVTTCSANTEVQYADGTKFVTIPYLGVDGQKTCPNCSVGLGDDHHPGCIQEICPKCGKFMHLDCKCDITYAHLNLKRKEVKKRVIRKRRTW